MEADYKIYFSTWDMFVKPLVFNSSHLQFGTWVLQAWVRQYFLIFSPPTMTLGKVFIDFIELLKQGQKEPISHQYLYKDPWNAAWNTFYYSDSSWLFFIFFHKIQDVS